MKAALLSVLLRALARTWRLRVHGTLPTAPAIVAFWHGTMLPVWYVLRHHRPVALVSGSADGTLLARLLTDWGLEVVRGSSSSGGREALATMTDRARKGLVLLTPDGPRGPAGVAKAGAVVAAWRAGVPLVPIRVRMERPLVFRRSWDRFSLPWPGSAVDVLCGEPMLVPSTADRTAVDAAIMALTEALSREEA